MTMTMRPTKTSKISLLLRIIGGAISVFVICIVFQANTLMRLLEEESSSSEQSMIQMDIPPAIPTDIPPASPYYSNAFSEIQQKLPFPIVPVSVVIPATASRLNVIPRLLQSIASGTRLPQQVVLAISDIPNDSNNGNAFLESLDIPESLLLKNVTITVIRSKTRKNAAQNRNLGAANATMPVLAFIDSDDLAGPLWMETLFHVYNSHQNADLQAVMHKWYGCKGGIPKDKQHLPLPTRDKILIANHLYPPNLSLKETAEWAAGGKKVNETNQMIDPGFNHPWWGQNHISVQRDVYQKVWQREEGLYAKREDTFFLSDLLMQNYTVGVIENYLTGYCKH